MKVAVICAMQEEISALCEKLEGLETETLCGVTVWRGSFGSHTVSVALSGIGKSCAAAATQLMLLREAPDCVFNIGLAGGCRGQKIGDAVVAERLVYHDFDLHISDSFRDVWNGFFPDPALRDTAQRACEAAGCSVTVGTVASGDIFVRDPVKKSEIIAKTGCSCVEMEAAAISHVCFRCGVPFASVKIVSDSADEQAEGDFDGSLRAFGARSAAVAAEFLCRL